MKVADVTISDQELRVMMESGFVLREAGRLDAAEAVFRGVLELIPRSEVPLVALATIELQRGKIDHAVALAEQARRVNPQSLYARVHHAEALLFGGRRDEAEGLLGEVIAADPASPHTQTARRLLEAADLITAATVNAVTSDK
jgi:predicted Zn-dependent protease